MANSKEIRKQFPKEQGLLDVFDADVLDEIRDAQDDISIDAIEIETKYRCPKCGYDWSGNPKPPRPGDEKKKKDDAKK